MTGGEAKAEALFTLKKPFTNETRDRSNEHYTYRSLRIFDLSI